MVLFLHLCHLASNEFVTLLILFLLVRTIQRLQLPVFLGSDKLFIGSFHNIGQFISSLSIKVSHMGNHALILI